MRLCFFSAEIVMERKRFRVLREIRAFRDSDNRAVRKPNLPGLSK